MHLQPILYFRERITELSEQAKFGPSHTGGYKRQGETFAFLDRISLDTTATAILDVSSNVPVLYRCLYDVDVEDSEQFQKLQKLAERTEALSPAKAAIFSGALDAECVWNLEGALTAVSYTHLDVYKRQERSTSATSSETEMSSSVVYQ